MQNAIYKHYTKTHHERFFKIINIRSSVEVGSWQNRDSRAALSSCDQFRKFSCISRQRNCKRIKIFSKFGVQNLDFYRYRTFRFGWFSANSCRLHISTANLHRLHRTLQFGLLQILAGCIEPSCSDLLQIFAGCAKSSSSDLQILAGCTDVSGSRKYTQFAQNLRFGFPANPRKLHRSLLLRPPANPRGGYNEQSSLSPA